MKINRELYFNDVKVVFQVNIQELFILKHPKFWLLSIFDFDEEHLCIIGNLSSYYCG